MTSAAAIAKMPTWPRRLQVDLGAAYCGVSPSKFRAQIRIGIFPEGSKDGGNILWFVEDLDAALDNIKSDGPNSGNDENDWMKSLKHDKN